MTLTAKVQGKTVQDNGDVAVSLFMAGPSFLMVKRGGGRKLRMPAKIRAKARALLEAGLIERRDYDEFVKTSAMGGTDIGEKHTIAEVTNIKVIQGDVKRGPFKKEKAVVSLLVKNDAD